jgi:galactose oxidase-like protein
MRGRLKTLVKGREGAMSRWRLAYIVPLAALALAAGSAALPASAAASGTFTMTGSMHAARICQSATLLPNGQVLAAGVGGASGPSAELYNPATGGWTVTGAMITPTDAHTATLLPNGQVLVTGGGTSGCAYGGISAAELYNPATGTWSPASGGLAACTTARACRAGSAATLLGDGDVLVTGGYSGLATTYPVTTGSAMLYNPATNSWTPTGSMSTSRADQSSTLLPDGQVLVAGGESVTKGKITLLSSAELYTP